VIARVLSEDEREISLELRDASVRLANEVRRALVQDVPTLAVDRVEIDEGTELSISDELLAQRLGLLVLASDGLEDLEVPGEEYVASLSLDVGCTSRRELVVTSRELASSEERVRPLDPDVPLAILRRGQRLRLKAFVRSGTGSEHAKWSPVTAVSLSRERDQATLRGSGERGTFVLDFETTGARKPRALVEVALRVVGVTM
jgi:DNA-directed RNA polymerase II subunit RPB3